MSERVDEDDSLDGVEHALLRGEGARLADGAPADRAAARRVVQRFAARERRQRLLIAGSSALALAAAVALVVGLKRRAEPAPVAALVTAAPQSSLVVESGRVTLAGGGGQVAPGSPVAAETLAALAPRTCLRAGSNVRLCTQSGAKLKLPRLGQAWEVELSEGAVTAELEAMTAGFTLRTRHGSAAVEGTLFSMALDPSHAFTTVLVERGRVRVTNRRLGEQAVLLVGQSARLGERFELGGVKQTTGEAAVATPQSRPSAPAPSGSAKSHSAAELLEEARQLRGAGHYAQAAQLYRRLVQQHPESAEARASLVSLGQLELGQLGQPEAALRSFRAYLAGPGQLRQEAEHGAIQALQRLGRKDEERRAIEAFLGRYPKSTQAGVLAQRLKQL